MPLTLNGSEQTALLVVDMQNGFCHPQGSFATLGLDVSMCNAAIAGCRRLVDAAHAAGVPVIYTRYVYRADYRDGGVLVQEIMPALGSSGSLAAGSWDAELVDELPAAGDDFVIDKNRYSAFYGTGLEPILTSLKVRNLVICGVTTNMCVETTARDAEPARLPDVRGLRRHRRAGQGPARHGAGDAGVRLLRGRRQRHGVLGLVLTNRPSRRSWTYLSEMPDLERDPRSRRWTPRRGWRGEI